VSCPTRICLARSVLAALLAVAAPRSAQSQDAPPDGATHDLRVESPSGQPILAELRFELRGTMEASAGGKSKKLEMRHETCLDFVDELLARDRPEPGDLDVRRTYLRWDQDGTEGAAGPRRATIRSWARAP
jgi:hypothetical protein